MSRDGGSATVEFVAVGLILLVPLLYLVVALSAVQRNVFAVTEAARAAGRALATADDPATALPRAVYAAGLALSDQGLLGAAELRWGPVGAGCDGVGVEVEAGQGPARLTLDRSVIPPTEPGAEFEVCIVRTFHAPGVPGILDSRRNTVQARFVVHLDQLRSVR